MLTALRHLLAIVLLPFLVVVGVPYWLITALSASDTRWSEGWFLAWPLQVGSAITIALGFTLLSWCMSLFAKIGQGTLAPWDPTRNLVSSGPYRLVRNPMISGVALMLLGQALWWGSWTVGFWACLFVAINHVYFVLFEEPGLEKRFGESYRLYKANVPRWFPRLRLRSSE
jgi:protein-S-isoprenylcysteine O-methyltransferase Ste14